MENETDVEYFTNHTARRFRLRPASEQEAKRIGVQAGWTIATKGGARVTFANARTPPDSDPALSQFLNDLGYFHPPRDRSNVPSHRTVSAR